MMKHILKFGDLFAGAGGLSLGFVLAGHPTVKCHPLFAIDNDQESLQSYANSMQWLSRTNADVLSACPATYERDIEKLNVRALSRLFKLDDGELDLLIGGPPCQGYSSANRQGSRTSKSHRNRLSKVFLDKVEALNPKMFLLENVQGVKWTQPTDDMNVKSSQLSFLPDAATKIESVQQFLLGRSQEIGYKTWFSVLNAVDFGVPQTRYRFFLLGVRADLIPSKNVDLDQYLEKSMEKNPVTVEDAIGDLPELHNGEKWAGNSYNPNSNTFVQHMRKFMNNSELNDHFTTNHADYVIERYKKIPEGGNWESIKELMSNYSKIDNTHSNIYRRLMRNAPAITISHYRKSMIIHPTQDRGLSFREACRLQSFPDWYQFCGRIDNRQQQLANAVPPLLASKIANAVASYWLDHIA